MKKLLTLFMLLVSFNSIATPVNVNTADAATIAHALHGIGLKKAQSIVAYREANGAFKSLEELGNVKGIGDKTLAKNQADILFSGAGATPAAVAKTPKAKAAPAPDAVTATPPVAPEAAAPAVEQKPKKTRKAKAAPPVPDVVPANTAPVANPLK